MISPKASLSILELANTELSAISYEAWLINRNEDALKENVATENLVFDFELFTCGRYNIQRNIGALITKSDEQGTCTNVNPVVLWHAVYLISAKELDPMS